MRVFRLCLLGLAALGACDSGAGDPDPVVQATPIDPGTTGTIRGRTLFKGAAPPNAKLPIGGNAECAALHSAPAYDEIVLASEGRLQNVLVYVKEGLEKFTFNWPKDPVRVSNELCIYRPRVSSVQVHQPIEFVNGDPTSHNIHGFSSQGDFNFTLLGKGSSNRVKLRRPEIVLRVKCDLHPWMIGYVGVLPHPFHRVTGRDGAFEMTGIPAGEYVIEAWHETLGVQTRKVKLEPNGTADLEFSFSPK
jgi:hypothetical protein